MAYLDELVWRLQKLNCPAAPRLPKGYCVYIPRFSERVPDRGFHHMCGAHVLHGSGFAGRGCALRGPLAYLDHQLYHCYLRRSFGTASSSLVMPMLIEQFKLEVFPPAQSIFATWKGWT